MTNKQLLMCVWTIIAFCMFNFATVVVAASFGSDFVDKMLANIPRLVAIEIIFFFASYLIVSIFIDEK